MAVFWPGFVCSFRPRSRQIMLFHSRSYHLHLLGCELLSRTGLLFTEIKKK
uniref:Uncharacterized protein n=1 Tax=Oryza brachyantha TaxID=4533 RepID=J3LJK4_ORYBR